MTLRKPWTFPYTIEDFERKYFTKLDIEVARCLIKDSFDWRLVSHSKKTGFQFNILKINYF